MVRPAAPRRAAKASALANLLLAFALVAGSLLLLQLVSGARDAGMVSPRTAAHHAANSLDEGSADDLDSSAGRRLLAERRRRLQQRAGSLKGCFLSYQNNIKAGGSVTGDPAGSAQTPRYPKSPGFKRTEVKERLRRAGGSTKNNVDRARKSACVTQDIGNKKLKSSVDCSLEANLAKPECVALLESAVECAEIDCRPQCYDGGIISTNTTNSTAAPTEAPTGAPVDPDDEEEPDEEVSLDSEEGDEVFLSVAAQLSEEDISGACAILQDEDFQADQARRRRNNRIPELRRSLLADDGEELSRKNRRLLATPSTLVTKGVKNLNIDCETDTNGICAPGAAPFDTNKDSWKVVNENLKNQGYFPGAYPNVRTDTNRGAGNFIGGRVVYAIKAVVQMQCVLSSALTALTVSAGFIAEAGVKTNGPEAVCLAAEVVATIANDAFGFAAEDANYHDGIINAYEILAGYENTLVNIHNQHLALTKTDEAITASRTAIQGSVGTARTNVRTKISSVENTVITSQDEAAAAAIGATNKALNDTIEAIQQVRVGISTKVTLTGNSTKAKIASTSASLNSLLSNLAAVSAQQTANLTALLNSRAAATRAYLSARINATQALIRSNLTDLRTLTRTQFESLQNETTRRFNRVDANTCRLRDETALLMRDTLYLTRIMLIPGGNRPGYDANPPAFVPVKCSTPDNPYACTAPVRNNILAGQFKSTLQGWACPGQAPAARRT